MVRKMLTRALAVLLLLTLCTIGSARAAGAQPPDPEQQNEFIPIDQLPPQEQYPAARLLVIAYMFVPAVLFLYLLSLSRRMAAVQREVERLETDLKRTGRT